MLTDLDIVVRAVAQGCIAADTPVSTVMSENVRYCYEDQPVDDALASMRAAQVRRLPVIDRDKRLVGVLSLGDVASQA